MDRDTKTTLNSNVNRSAYFKKKLDVDNIKLVVERCQLIYDTLHNAGREDLKGFKQVVDFLQASTHLSSIEIAKLPADFLNKLCTFIDMISDYSFVDANEIQIEIVNEKVIPKPKKEGDTPLYRALTP